MCTLIIQITTIEITCNNIQSTNRRVRRANEKNWLLTGWAFQLIDANWTRFSCFRFRFNAKMWKYFAKYKGHLFNRQRFRWNLNNDKSVSTVNQYSNAFRKKRKISNSNWGQLYWFSVEHFKQYSSIGNLFSVMKITVANHFKWIDEEIFPFSILPNFINSSHRNEFNSKRIIIGMPEIFEIFSILIAFDGISWMPRKSKKKNFPCWMLTAN